ncbi:MAG: TolC family protein [bacterium]
MQFKNGLFNFILLCILFINLNHDGLAFAQDSLTLEEALHLARQNNLQIKKQRMDQAVAQLERKVQKANRLPAMEVSLSSSYFSKVNEIDLSQTIGIPGRRVALGGHDRTEFLLALRQPIFTGSRLQSQVALAENSLLAEEAKFEVLTNEVYHQIYLLFYKAQNLWNQKKILQTSLKRLNVQLENVRNLYEAAQAMAFDTLQVYNQILAMGIEQQNNALQMKLSNLQMAHLLDLPSVRPIAESELERPLDKLAALPQLRQEAMEKRAELKTLGLARQNALIQKKLARSTFYPTIFGQVNLHYAKPGLDPVTNDWMNYYSLGVNLQWNLWRWQGDQRKVEQAQLIHNRLQLEERELQNRISLQVEESYEKLQFSRQQWQLAEELQAQQEERFRIISAQHQNDVASTNELISAEADLTRSELQTQQALINYYLNLASLKYALGTLVEFDK